jgi:hypothetical protein
MSVAVNKPVGDNARKGAVKKRSQVKAKLGGATAWTKRSSFAADDGCLGGCALLGGGENGDDAGAREIGTSLPFQKATPSSGSFSSNHVSAASAFAKTASK